MKARIIVIIEITSEEIANIKFKGINRGTLNASWDDVSITRNASIEVDADKRDTASHIRNPENSFLCKNMGMPVSSLFPPGTVKSAANIIVTIKTGTRM
ncbi:hypothetical protein SLE2022_289010 [Rubroshorea leprosula]